MKKHLFKTIEAERKKIQETIVKQQTVIETDEDTLIRFIAGESYHPEDITKHAPNLVTNHKQITSQFLFVDKVHHFRKYFEEIKLAPDNPVICIAAKAKAQWILLCVVQKEVEGDQMNVILYKDPCGNSIPEALEMQLDKTFTKFKVIENNLQDQQADDESSYGPLTLRNLDILLEFLEKKTDLSTFPKVQFATSKDLKKDRLRIVCSLIDKLSKDEKLKSALKKFVDNLPWELISNMEEYHKILNEELQKDSTQVDHDKIKQAKVKHFVDDKIDKFMTDYQITQNGDDYQLQIVKDFPKQMKQIIGIFKLLHAAKVDESIFEVSETISRKLGIDTQKMKRIYEFKAKLEKTQMETLPIGNIDEIMRNLSYVENDVECVNCTPLDEILSGIKIHTLSAYDPEPPEEQEVDEEPNVPEEDTPETKSDDLKPTEDKKSDYVLMVFENDEVQDLLGKYQKIQENYKKWETSDLEKIQSWAKKVKGNLGSAEDEICEAIAIMDRAYNIIKGRLRFRIPQILSLLLFLHAPKEQGRICEVLPGEGKAVIISSLATIKCLQGHKVDIITNTQLLAEKNVKEMRDFFTVFALTVSTNNPKVSKSGYLADVLIGTINNFQTDYLKEYLEDPEVRRNRKFEVLILLEIDCMMIDKGENIARLSSFYPGMEFLRYIYIKIWKELHHAEEDFVKETEQKVKRILKKPSSDESRVEINDFFQKLIATERTTIKDKLKASDPAKFPLVPAHWTGFVDSQVENWLKSALHAKYNCEENKQYTIEKTASGKLEVVRIDYLNRGLSEHNTIWVNGLRQFIELKHNLELSCETLTTGLISNISYIKNYESGNVFGLTTTLGSTAEQELLMQVYKINFVSIPPSITRNFTELEGSVFGDESWVTEATLKITSYTDDYRAVLAIFETQEDLTKIRNKLELLANSRFRIRLLSDENLENPEAIKGEDIILATSTSEFGTNFNIVKFVEQHGGLHVCVCFLPSSVRIEGQLFGRTARHGRTGSAQLLLKKSNLQELGLTGEMSDFVKFKLERDSIERKKLKYVNDVVVKKLKFLDKLHDLFMHFYKTLSQTATTQRSKYALKDLKEFFTFWVIKKNYKIATIAHTGPAREFAKFTQEAQPIINGKICHNPYNCIGLVKFYLRSDELEKAKSVLEYVLAMSDGKNDEILPGVHMKLFEAHIKSGRIIFEKLDTASRDLIKLEFDKQESYKAGLNKHLDKALKAVRKEIQYIENNFTGGNADFMNILKSDRADNPLVKQIHSRLCCLQFYEGNIEQLIETLDSTSGDIALNGRVKLKLQNLLKLSSEPDKIRKFLNDDVLNELRSVGIDSVYSIGKMGDVSDDVREAAQNRIKVGLTALTVGLTVPPSFPAMSVVAITLLSEGVVDLSMDILHKNNSDIYCSNMVKRKIIEARESILSVGASFQKQSDTLVKRTVTLSQECASSLLASKRLIALNNRIINNIDRNSDGMHKKVLRIVVPYSPSDKKNDVDPCAREQEICPSNVKDDLKKLDKGIKSFQTDSKELVEMNKSLWNSITKQLMSPKLFELSMTEMVAQFIQTLANAIRQNAALLKKLQTTTSAEILDSLENLTNKELFDNMKTLVAQTIIERLMATEVGQQFSEIKDYMEKSPQISSVVGKFTGAIEKKLPGGKENNNVAKVIKEICDKVEKKLLVALRQVMETTRQVAEFGDMAQKASKAFKERFCGKCCRKMNDYKILGLARGATVAAVKYQYKKQVLMIQANKQIGEKEKEERLARLKEAHDNIVEYARKK